MREGITLYEIILLKAGEEIKKLMERSPKMDIQILRKEEGLVAVVLNNVLTVKKNVLNQLTFITKIDMKELENIEVLGWVHGRMIDRAYSDLRFALVNFEGGLHLVKLSHIAWGKEVFEHMNTGPQIFVV